MFYSTEVLLKRKGGFAVVWLAGTLGSKSKKLSKQDIVRADLVKYSERIIEPEEPMALRLSASLMLGVARIYGQQYSLFVSDVENVNKLLKKAFSDVFKPYVDADALLTSPARPLAPWI